MLMMMLMMMMLPPSSLIAHCLTIRVQKRKMSNATCRNNSSCPKCSRIRLTRHLQLRPLQRTTPERQRPSIAHQPQVQHQCAHLHQVEVDRHQQGGGSHARLTVVLPPVVLRPLLHRLTLLKVIGLLSSKLQHFSHQFRRPSSRVPSAV